MADVTKVQMLIDQSRKLLEDHPYDEADPMTYIVSLDVFHDELKFIIKALEELKTRMSFDEINAI